MLELPGFFTMSMFFTPKDQRFAIKIIARRGEVGSASLLSKLLNSII